MLNVFDRLMEHGAFKTYNDVAESLRNPRNFNHEDIFFWGISELKEFLEGLLGEMSEQERREAIGTLNPDNFDFASVVPVRQKRMIVGGVLSDSNLVLVG